MSALTHLRYRLTSTRTWRHWAFASKTRPRSRPQTIKSLWNLEVLKDRILAHRDTQGNQGNRDNQETQIEIQAKAVVAAGACPAMDL